MLFEKHTLINILLENEMNLPFNQNVQQFLITFCLLRRGWILMYVIKHKIKDTDNPHF